jgi:hypothetical protein
MVATVLAAGLLALVGTEPTETAFPGTKGKIVFQSNRTTGTGVYNRTGGDSVTRAEGGGLRVPKRDLASAPLVLTQNKQLKLAEGLQLAPVLKRELLNCKVKINIATGHDSYEAWREGDHDDLVLAVAMGCWTGER